MKGLPCIKAERNATITLAGILFDASAEEPEYLLTLGDEGVEQKDHTLLSNLFSA